MQIDRSLVFAVSIGFLLLIVNVFLIVDNRKLAAALENSRQPIIEEGFRFSEMRIVDLDGNERFINLADGSSKTLIFVFNSGCQYCKQQYPHWKDLYDKLDGGWNALAITSENDREKLRLHIEEEKLAFPIIGIVSTDEIRRARMSFTPMTIAVDADGVVTKVWPGLWTKGFNLNP